MATSGTSGATETRDRSGARFLSGFALASSHVVLLTGVLGVGFWLAGLPNLEIFEEDIVPIALLASISYLVLALPMMTLVILPKHRALRWISLAATVALLVIYLLKGLSYLTGLGTDLEELIAPNPGEQTGFPANRISPVAAVCLTISCISLLIIFVFQDRNRPLRSCAVLLSAGVALVGIIAVLGYAFGTPLLYGGEVRPVAPISAIALMFLGLGVCASSGPGYWPVDILMGSSVRARMMRAFLPLTLILVFLIGVATVRIADVSNNPVLGASLISIAAAVFVAAIVYRMSKTIGGQIDAANAVRREAEERLRAANEKLTMLGSITRHDIMNQVTVLKGFAVIGEEASEPEEKSDALRRISNASDSIEQLVRFAGVYQEVGLKAPEWIDVRRAFEGGAAGVARFPVKVLTDVDGIEVFADRMLEKVFTNLIENSRRHGEHVTKISLIHETDGKNLKVIYEDDGVGISDADRSKLFMRGFGKNTGLGMYLSKEILAITGLEIAETGVHGKGVRFEIGVPEGRFRIRGAA